MRAFHELPRWMRRKEDLASRALLLVATGDARDPRMTPAMQERLRERAKLVVGMYPDLESFGEIPLPELTLYYNRHAADGVCQSCFMGFSPSPEGARPGPTITETLDITIGEMFCDEG